MLDPKLIRANPEMVAKKLALKGTDTGLEEFLNMDEVRRRLLVAVEEKKNFRNRTSQQIGKLKKAGEEPEELMAQVKAVGQEIKELDDQLRALEERMEDLLLMLPNLPHDSVPVGAGEDENVEVRRWGKPREFDFSPLPHWELGTRLDILTLKSGQAGAVTVYKGAVLVWRGLCESCWIHVKTRLREIFPPFMVVPMYGAPVNCPSLPMTCSPRAPICSVPTAEVPLTNLHRDEILNAGDLPLYLTAYTACFRAEAGSHGRDTRGIIRQHQFNKVELVKITNRDQSYEELEKMTADAEEVLKQLGLPYRVVALCTGDLGFSAAKTYDIEVWLPYYGEYREISSCSNCEDFQARRANIRYRHGNREKVQYCHTLNGSGVAVGRTVAAILENYQQADGSIVIPEVLVPYMGGLEVITMKHV